MDTLPRAPVTFNSVDTLLHNHATANPDHDAIVSVDPDTNQTIHISYKRLHTLVTKAAGLLKVQGISKGDRFAILMHNTPEVLLFELAAATIGATTVPLDSKRDTLDRKLYKLTDTHAKALYIRYTDDSLQADLQHIQKELPGITITSWSTWADIETLLDPQDSSPVRSIATLDTPYVILYTSGTTALPKGVILTTRACLLNAAGIVNWQQFTHADRFNIVLPLHHINSTIFCLSMLLVGGTIILNTRYSASKFWQIVAAQKATNTSVVPTILHDLLMRANDFQVLQPDISSLARICVGSAPVLPEETLKFYRTFGVRVVQGYGQTETALRVAGVPIDVDDSTYKQLVQTNTIGTELANNHLAIMDAQNKQKKEKGHGEICIAGPILANGYLGNPTETNKAFVNSWFHSGDLGYWQYVPVKHRNGSQKKKKFYYIIGRIKEIIIKGGVNISPSAIEDALIKEFSEIDEVSVVGYPDSRMGEEIAAAIVLKKLNTSGTDHTKLVEGIIQRAHDGSIPGISPYEAPTKIFILDTLPKTSTGKIQRVEVKKITAESMKQSIQGLYHVLPIDPNQTAVLHDAVTIHNARWQGLPATTEAFRARATNGLLFGVFDASDRLVGSLSCVSLAHSTVEKLTTWDQATAHGTLANNDLNGDTLLCVSISVQASSARLTTKQHTHKNEKKLNLLAKQYINEYVNSDKDHVLNFHKKSKGGLPGATAVKILENGRPEDRDSMGYNVLMQYPTITKETKITQSPTASPSVQLIEAALLYAQKHGIRKVIAFSRPAGYRAYLEALT